jgi:hypothetical protein
MAQPNTKYRYTPKAQIGDVILPYSGRNEDKIPFAPSRFGNIPPSKDKGLEFVVERTAMTGGGYNCPAFLNDYFPDGWHVTARQLKPDGSYDTKGKTINFYQSGCFIDMIAQVPVVRKMRMTFIEEDAQ